MKRITIYDVAKEAGVSLATVSRVINGSDVVREDTRVKVEEAINKYGGTITIYDTIDLQLARKRYIPIGWIHEIWILQRDWKRRRNWILVEDYYGRKKDNNLRFNRM